MSMNTEHYWPAWEVIISTAWLRVMCLMSLSLRCLPVCLSKVSIYHLYWYSIISIRLKLKQVVKAVTNCITTLVRAVNCKKKIISFSRKMIEIWVNSTEKAIRKKKMQRWMTYSDQVLFDDCFSAFTKKTRETLFSCWLSPLLSLSGTVFLCVCACLCVHLYRAFSMQVFTEATSQFPNRLFFSRHSDPSKKKDHNIKNTR